MNWRRGKSGATLVELLVGLSLIMVILGMTAALMSEYNRLIRFDSSQQVLLEASQLALNRISSEVISGIEFLEPSPDSAATSSSLRFVRLRPNQAPRFPETLDPTALPVSWDPFAASETMEVLYRVSEDSLMRKVDDRERGLVSPVVGFAAEFQPGPTLQLSLSVDRRGRVFRRISRVFLLTRFP